MLYTIVWLNNYLFYSIVIYNFFPLIENLNLVGGPQSSSSSHDPLAFSSDLLQLPSIYHFLPHLLSSPDSLVPAFRRALNPRNSVTMVMGVPTVKRPVESYLIATLQNLIDNLSIQERAEAVIIVFIAEVFILS